MSIRMIVDIGTAVESGPRNEFGVGVAVHTEEFRLSATPEGEGATWCGICKAINDYMRSRGAREFDCLKPRQAQ